MRKQDIKSQQIRIIESHLRNYSSYKVGINNLKKQLEYIMPNMTANYELLGGSSGTFVISSNTEKYAIDRIESHRALQLHESIKEYELIINSIDSALEDLTEMERKFIRLRYFEKKPIHEITGEIGYSSDKSVFNLRNHIFDRLLISLKGILSI